MDQIPQSRNITNLLVQIAAGDDGAADELIGLVYDELQNVAREKLLGERRNHTLGPSDVVHEAWLRLVGALEKRKWPSRKHFYRAAAEAMRRVLIDHARRRGRLRHGGGRKRVTLNVLDYLGKKDSPEFFEVDEAVRRLEREDGRLGQLVRLRFYAGLSVSETAETLGVSEGTVQRDWTFARSWLYQALRESE